MRVRRDPWETKGVDRAAVEALGGGGLREPPDTPLGARLNHGARVARGLFCQKMGDDWYAPSFM